MSEPRTGHCMSCAEWQRQSREIDRLRAQRSCEERRLRDAIVSARWHLAKGRAFWNGPCHQCDEVLEKALARTTAKDDSVYQPAIPGTKRIAKTAKEGE